MKFDSCGVVRNYLYECAESGWLRDDKMRLQLQISNFRVFSSEIIENKMKNGKKETTRRNEDLSTFRDAVISPSLSLYDCPFLSRESRNDPSIGTRVENRHVLADPPARGGMNVGARQDE